MDAASAKDRAHFAAIASAEETADEERFLRAAQTPAGQRMIDGIRLGAAMPMTPAILAEIDARTDAQMELSRRRIALGLGRD